MTLVNAKFYEDRRGLGADRYEWENINILGFTYLQSCKIVYKQLREY